MSGSRAALTPAQASAARIASADTGGRAKPRLKDDLFARGDVYNYNPGRPRRTALEEETSLAADLEERRDAARAVARGVMLRGHGCSGPRCRDGAHEADRMALGVVLAVLGLGAGREGA